MRKNLLPQSQTIQEQNSLRVIVTLSLSLQLQRLRAATNSSGQEPSLQFDSEQAIILYGGGGGGRSRQPITATTTSSFL
jgi:hypothetical protein